jgi:thymidylate synthase
MNSNFANILKKCFIDLNDKFKNGEIIDDKSGCKIVEIISPVLNFSMSENEEGFVDFGEIRKSPRKYIQQEKEWYLSQELSIEKVKNVKIWNSVADKNGQINSNYGYLVFGKGNYSQFSHAYESLQKNKFSRQGIIIYTRPSIQVEANALGGSDFICTIDQNFLIRNNKLMCIVDQRSCDCIYGLFSDLPWFVYVYKEMYKKLKETYPDLEYGTFYWHPHSLHCYERHFNLLKEIAES